MKLFAIFKSAGYSDCYVLSLQEAVLRLDNRKGETQAMAYNFILMSTLKNNANNTFVQKLLVTFSTHFYKKVIYLLLLLLSLDRLPAKPSQSPYIIDSEASSTCNEAYALRYTQPDSAALLYNACYKEALEKNDTLKAINTLQYMAELSGHHARYKDAYDHYWTALRLADESQNQIAKANVYLSIGRLYSYYKREGEALKYIRISLNLKKALAEEGKLDQSALLTNYMAITATYRQLEKPKLAQVYLDSASLFYNEKTMAQAVKQMEFERASILAQEGEYKEALEILKWVVARYKEDNPAYLVLVYTTVGDIYRHFEDYTASENYYLMALETSEQYQSHIDFTPIVHQKLSEIYLLKDNYQKAFASIKTAKELDATFFDSRSKNNLPLLEIQDAFRVEKERQEELIRRQRLEQLEQEDKIWFLQRTILIVAIAFIVIVGGIYFKHERSKHLSEKRLLKKKQELEIQKAKEVLEIKNKELTASALQAIEKDELLSNLKEELRKQKDTPNAFEIGKLVKSIDLNSSRNWEEFEVRFMAVNEGFYQRLSEKFPSLSQNDQKICALIKLNFSSKDMAKLLGISIESVHTNRYRLRKKLNLERSTNLEDFIAKV
ncbi:DNA-binding CsgD family transcriptional regulator [Catalinimonas alkaloidigena]|uniref:tetratricopeptide repeat protein n=1 Tax=Catalinimonas alkaloidigena TaxID=1075417 RepID=UPI002405B670|nr:hypothetical protein [Catalinimonas alkaloidigena]MDF9796438.1 DNA-binding CsgD family transcriptional regulator [Catalinimonas alkaloidigena]